MHSFNAPVRPEGKWWIINIPELGKTTQARNAAYIQNMATDLAGVALEVHSSEIHLTVSRQIINEEPAP